MTNYNLSDAAKAIMMGEDSKSIHDSNIASKKGMRNQDKHPDGEVGSGRIHSKTAYGTNDAGEIGQAPERGLTDKLPDYTKGAPHATPPGATPPVGAQSNGVGASVPSNQPQSSMGRTDIMNPTKSDATPYEAIRDRIAGKLAPQMMQMNPGAHFQSYGEDVEALLQGENLSEEFKERAATIFEAAVLSRVEPIVEEIENQLLEEFEIAVETIKEEMANKIDDYLNYMVEEWMKDNELAIESGLRSEIAESFISSLHGVFLEHYINVPEEKVDIIEELSNQLSEVEQSLNEEIARSVELSKELNEQKKVEAIYTACEGLTQTQVEKLKSLAENVNFTTENEFVDKLYILKESYFKTDVKFADNNALDDEVLIEEEDRKIKSNDADIDLYARTISKTLLR
jgi:hypothetical protein